jgi:anaerobic selenocysteine-containing dehydrogenase
MGERPIDDLRAMVTGDTPADRVLDVMVRAGRYGDRFGAVPDGLTLDKLKAHPHGIDLGPLQPRLPNALQTPDGAVAAAPPEFVARLKEIVETLATSADSPVLIGRRDVRSNNSWLHNVKGLVKGKDRCTLWVNPLDAAEWGMTDGDTALVASSVGELEVPVEVTDRTMVGVVSLPHGWGHDAPGTELKIANEHAGVNMNALVPPTDIDPLSGNATLTGIPVNVTAAVHERMRGAGAGDQRHRLWRWPVSLSTTRELSISPEPPTGRTRPLAWSSRH